MENQSQNILPRLIKLEELAMTAMGIYVLYLFDLGLPIWAWALLFFAPDLSMLGYMAGTKTGAFCYNLVHHRGIAILVMTIGLFLAKREITAIGILLFAHSSFDRMMGYGLKFADDFQHTHLGWMGKQKPED